MLVLYYLSIVVYRIVDSISVLLLVVVVLMNENM